MSEIGQMFFSGLCLLQRTDAKIFFLFFLPSSLLHFLVSIFEVMMRDHDGASGDEDTCTTAKGQTA